MTWGEWAAIWGIALVATGIIVGLVFALNFWALLIIFPAIFVGLGYGVTRA